VFNFRVVVHRKQSPKVRDGRVQKKNNWDLTAHYSQVKGLGFVIDRRRPGKGYRHLLLKDHVERFSVLLPDWEELSRGLDAVILAEGDPGTHGWHDDGLVAICAWRRDMTESVTAKYAGSLALNLDQLSVPVEKRGSLVHILWSEDTARAFQLLHIFLHELGHHHDRMTTGTKRQASRGEGFAEQYANEHGQRIWADYVDEFGHPA
jgi:hypothetical protein